MENVSRAEQQVGPDLGMPPYDGHAVGRPMRADEIEDVVAWMAAHRVEFPGRPSAERASVVGKER